MGGISLTVTTKEKPEQSLFDRYLRLHPEMCVRGQLGDRASSKRSKRSWGPDVELGRKGAGEDEPPLEISGPERVYEDDDMDPEVAKLTPAPCWQIIVGCELSNEQNWTDAGDFAVFVAEMYKGAAYTSEAGVVWPDNQRQNSEPALKQSPTEEPKIDALKLEWFVHSSKVPAQSAQLFLDALKNFPGARPVRFGTTEPFQGQLGRQSDKPFLGAWEENRKEGRGDTLFFKSRLPCLGGYISFPMLFGIMEDHPRSLKPTEDIIHIQLEFDEGVLSQELRESAVKLFLALAKGFRCFYARGFVERGYSWYRGGLMIVPGKTKLYPTPLGREWMGIPPVVAWLNWFGRPYRELVMDSLKGISPVVTEDGVFIRLGEKPADLHQLEVAEAKLDLPPKLLAIRAEPGLSKEVMAAVERGDAWVPPTYKARGAGLMPKLDD